MIAIAMLLLAQAPQSGPWNRYEEKYGERLGPGPHTLVISDGTAMTRMEYKSGAACARARDSILRQFKSQHPNLIAGGPSAFCVPR